MTIFNDQNTISNKPIPNRLKNQYASEDLLGFYGKISKYKHQITNKSQIRKLNDQN